MLAASVEDVATSSDLARRLDIDVPILADTSARVAKSFGIYDLPGSMGPFSAHSFWVIDRQGTIRFRQVSLEMHVPFDEVMAAVRRLGS